MDKVLHRAATRGHADHGWLDTYHTFSFADYYDPKRIHFGALRVLNDDTVAPGEGFGTHPHANMEIVSIPLSGALRHRDSMGYVQELRPGGIQVMSAGTGITHSEFNASDTEPVKFLQIWVLPDARGHRPRYDQLTLAPAVRDRGARGFRERACGMDSPAGLVSYARPRCGTRGGLSPAALRRRRLPVRAGGVRRNGRRDPVAARRARDLRRGGTAH